MAIRRGIIWKHNISGRGDCDSPQVAGQSFVVFYKYIEGVADKYAIPGIS